MTDAARQGEAYHRCVCVIVHEREDGSVSRDECPTGMVPMDQAFCDGCETNQHHLLPGQAANPVTR